MEMGKQIMAAGESYHDGVTLTVLVASSDVLISQEVAA